MQKIKYIFLFMVFLTPIIGDENCPFCNDQIIDAQSYYQDDLVMCLVTHKPVVEGHCLIIPKRHIARFNELTDEEHLRIAQLINNTDIAVKKAFDISAYLILQKNGKEAGASVPGHAHFHYIPRKAGSSSFFFLLRFLVSGFMSPLSSEEMHLIIDKIREGF